VPSRLLSLAIAAAITAPAVLLPAVAGRAASSTLCGSQTALVAGGAYTVQNNEWNSSASECVTTDGNADFTVANSAISNPTNGAPGGYPAIYQGCHWGSCTSGSALPIQVGELTPGSVTTNWNTSQTGTGAYDVAYDIWFNQTPTTSGQPNAEELMVWLNHNGSVQPSGSVVASNVSIGGHTYNIWEAQDSTWKDVSYVMTSGTTSVNGLDVGLLAADSVNRGYMSDSDYLIDVEAGFELWQGGAGLTTNSFALNVNGGVTPPPPPGNGCSATYSVVNSWQNGFQAQVTVTNNGTSPTSNWRLNWAFPAQINNLWNGSYTQSGSQVTVTNASYNASVAPGATTSVGFTATGSAAPPTVTCTAG
jgi:cellulase/cellobiase CelA1